MPLFYQHTINDSTRLAVWHITEDESFFEGVAHISRQVTHPHKRLQHLAGRFLLTLLSPNFPIDEIEINTYKKPFLPGNGIRFSISHCGDYAAAIVSTKYRVGIDVEAVTHKIQRVKERFLSPNELGLLQEEKLLSESDKLHTLFWSAKEAIYKWHGNGPLSFKNNMGMDRLHYLDEEGWIEAHFTQGKRIDLLVNFRFFDDLCLAWLLQ
jgi:phosphopantetheinyl transferase